VLLGYARVSTPDQQLDLQLDALRAAGCERLYQDVGSGANFQRPGLDAALAYARPGDVLVAWRLDRVGRSLGDLIQLMEQLQRRDIGLRSLQESIDTTTSTGKLVFHIFGALAEFERALIRERTTAGLAAARARGRLGGRPRKLTLHQIAMAQSLMADRNNSPGQVADMLHISKSTLYRAIRRENGHTKEPAGERP
jgi:DNA invertase Pin-like site-specific DNA recombinase